LASLLFAPWSKAHAQAVSATLLGSVSDKTGASVANAQVTIQEIATGIIHEVRTNETVKSPLYWLYAERPPMV
jgi:hypothetical protein